MSNYSPAQDRFKESTEDFVSKLVNPEDWSLTFSTLERKFELESELPLGVFSLEIHPFEPVTDGQDCDFGEKVGSWPSDDLEIPAQE